VCFRCCLDEFEAEFYEKNPLLLHIIHFSRLVRSQNSTNMMLKNAQKERTHMSTQHNNAWQTGSQRVQLAIPSGAQLYYKWFSHSIQILGIFGLHHVFAVALMWLKM
jgi:hypothetical protein